MADEIVNEADQSSNELIDLLPEPRRGIGWDLGCRQVLFQPSSGRLFIRHVYPEREYEIQDKDLRNDVYFLVRSLSDEVKRQWENLDRDIESSITLSGDLQQELAALKHENDDLRAFIDQRSASEEGSTEYLANKLEAAKAERAADKAGFEAVIRELREEVAALKGGAK